MQDPGLERWWLRNVKTASGGYPASNSMATGEVKRQRSETDLSPQSRTGQKSVDLYLYSPHMPLNCGQGRL